MSKPSVLLIPGSFALPEFYDQVMNAVAAKGYEVKGLHLPSVGLRAKESREGTPATMYDDAAFIATAAEKLADEGKDVVLIAHSYGGIPVSQSTKGLSKTERQAAGKKGGIVRLAYMTALVPPVGTPAMGMMTELPPDSQLSLKVDEQGWMHQDVQQSAPVIFSDLPLDEAMAWMEKFPNHSAVSFANELTHAGYKDIPAAYLLCEEDKCVVPLVQQAGIDAIEKESGNKVDVTTVKSGHCPMATQEQKTIDWMMDVVGKA